MIDSYQVSLLMVPFIMSAVCGLAPLIFSGRKYDMPIKGFVAAILIWAIGVAMRISATTVPAEALWHNVRMLGPSIAAASFFIFSAQYTGQTKWLNRKRLTVLATIPTITLFVSLTNQYHGLLRSSVDLVAGKVYIMEYTPGVWYFIHSGYSYSLVAIGFVWLMLYSTHDTVKEQRIHRVVILVSSVLVMVTNLIYNLDLTAIDWTPVAGGVWALMTATVARRYRIFGLTPLARKAIIKEIPQAVITINRNLTITDINPATKHLFGVTPSDVVGSKIGPSMDIFEQDLDPLIRSDGANDRVETADGRFFSITVSNITTTNALIGKTITFNEITDQVARQKQLEKQKVELELRNQEVEQKKKELQDQNKKLEEFAGVITHDLRNPLNVIQGHTEILKEQVVEENIHLNEIESTATEMEQLTDELLELSRVGNAIQSKSNVDIAELANHAWSNVDVPQCDISVEIPTDSEVLASSSDLCRVFENLYRNADEHNEGALEIKVGMLDSNEMEAPSSDENKSGFYIEDTGTGIPDPIKGDIFERGYTSNDNGTGFGLAIVSEVIEAHGWEISITDAEHGGARFEITQVELSNNSSTPKSEPN